jgi:hypothetical protein
MTMATAAARIINPSAKAEKYSTLPWPKLWLASAGLAATRRDTSAMIAATRLTTDSSASESRPTEPVTR